MLAIILKLVSLLFLGLFIFGVVIMLRTWRQAKFVKPKWIIFGQIIALLSLAAFSILAKNPIGMYGWLILIMIGVISGIFYGKFVKVTQSAKGIMMNYTLPYIITWAALLALTQFVTITSGHVPIITISLAILNLGLNLGLNGKIIWNYQAVSRNKQL